MVKGSGALSAEQQRLLGEAVAKLRRGEHLTEREARAHKKFQAVQQEQWRQRIYRDVPQKDFAAMCGGSGRPKQTKQLQDMERQWGLPFARESINLFEFLPALWEFLLKHGPAFRLLLEASDGDESNLTVEFFRARIRKLNADADASEMRNAEKERLLVERDKVHLIFERLVARVHRACDRAQANWGVRGFEFIAMLAEGFAEDIRGVIDVRSHDSATETEVVDSDATDSGHARRRRKRSDSAADGAKAETDS